MFQHQHSAAFLDTLGSPLLRKIGTMRNFSYDETIPLRKEPPLPPPARGFKRYYILGDLHGSAIKLLLFAEHIGACLLDEREKANFIEFYKNYDEMRPYELETMSAKYRINFKKNVNFHGVIILIGDVFYDRGKSDYLTLFLIILLEEKGIQVILILGNHDFLALFSMPDDFCSKLVYDENKVRSLPFLHDLLSSKHPLYTLCFRSKEYIPSFFDYPLKDDVPLFSHTFALKYKYLFFRYIQKFCMHKVLQLQETTLYNGIYKTHLLLSHAPVNDAAQEIMFRGTELLRSEHDTARLFPYFGTMDFSNFQKVGRFNDFVRGALLALVCPVSKMWDVPVLLNTVKNDDLRAYAQIVNQYVSNRDIDYRGFSIPMNFLNVYGHTTLSLAIRHSDYLCLDTYFGRHSHGLDYKLNGLIMGLSEDPHKLENTLSYIECNGRELV